MKKQVGWTEVTIGNAAPPLVKCMKEGPPKIEDIGEQDAGEFRPQRVRILNPEHAPNREQRVRIIGKEPPLKVQEMPGSQETQRLGEIKTETAPLFFNNTVLKKAVEHVKSNLSCEMGGLFLGHRYRTRDESVFVVVNEFIPAHHGEATRVEIQITHDDAREALDAVALRGLEEEIVGWLHSHPNMPAAPSPQDINAMPAYQINSGQFAMIIDPVRNEIGIFRLKEGEPTNEGGFMVTGNIPEQEAEVFKQLRFSRKQRFSDPEPSIPQPVLKERQEEQSPIIKIGRPTPPKEQPLIKITKSKIFLRKAKRWLTGN